MGTPLVYKGGTPTPGGCYLSPPMNLKFFLKGHLVIF